MADELQLERLRQGVEAWNLWWDETNGINDIDDDDIEINEINLSKANLSGANLNEVTLIGADLSEADLSEANLSEAVLIGANLSRADLSEANLSEAVLVGAVLIGANLSRANLSRADLSEANLSGANLSEANLSGSVPSEANLSRADLSGANLSGADLSLADLSLADLSEANLRADLSGADLSGADLSRADLSGANLSDANLSDANLSNANLFKANLFEANLIDTDLSNANFSKTILSNANIEEAKVLNTDFSKAVFTGACLKDWNTNRGTNLEGAEADYIYLDIIYLDIFWKQKTKPWKFTDRRPHSGTFKPGEFAALFQQVIDTVDLIFVDGIDWQAFFASFQELRQQYNDADLTIQAIEKKSGGSFVVRLEIAESADKAALQQSWEVIYGENQSLKAQLWKMEGKLEGYKEQLEGFQQKVLQGMTDQSASSNTHNYYAPVSGVVASSFSDRAHVSGNTFIQNTEAEKNLAAAAQEIQALLDQLSTTYPTETFTQKAQVVEMAIAQAQTHPTLWKHLLSALNALNQYLTIYPFNPLTGIIHPSLQTAKSVSLNLLIYLIGLLLPQQPI